MKWADKFIDLFIGIVVRLFILLTFLVAAIAVGGLYEHFRYNNGLQNGWGEVVLMAVLLVANCLIAWYTGKWLIFQPQKAGTANFFLIWIILIFTHFMLFAMALSGLGSSQ